MGMTVSEYNRITYRDLMLKIDGFQDREQYTESMFRMVGFSAQTGSHVRPKDQPKTLNAYWPMRADEAVKKEAYSFGDKKEAFRELLNLVNNGKA